MKVNPVVLGILSLGSIFGGLNATIQFFEKQDDIIVDLTSSEEESIKGGDCDNEVIQSLDYKINANLDAHANGDSIYGIEVTCTDQNRVNGSLDMGDPEP